MVKKKKSNISVRTQLFVATGAVFILVGFGLFVGWLDSNMDTKLPGKNESVALKDVTLKGTSTCLGHRDSGSQHTMECALGLKTSDGTVYAIKGGAMPVATDPFEVTGTLTPASGDEKYDIAGTLTVK